jgi:hypothetical protein
MNALVESWWVVLAGLAAYGLKAAIVDIYGSSSLSASSRTVAAKVAPLAGFILFLFLIFSGNSE